MSDSINLVSPKNNQLEKEQANLRLAGIAAFAAMIMVVAIAVVVFVINLTLPINSIKQQEAVSLSNISQLHKKLTQYYYVEDRLDNLAKVVSARQKIPDLMDALLAIIPQNLAISSLEINSKNVSFILSGPSLNSLNQFIDNLTALNQQKKLLKNVVVQELSVDVKSANYAISVQASVQ